MNFDPARTLRASPTLAWVTGSFGHARRGLGHAARAVAFGSVACVRLPMALAHLTLAYGMNAASRRLRR